VLKKEKKGNYGCTYEEGWERKYEVTQKNHLREFDVRRNTADFVSDVDKDVTPSIQFSMGGEVFRIKQRQSRTRKKSDLKRTKTEIDAGNQWGSEITFKGKKVLEG